MTTLPNMGIELPVQGGDSGTWDDKINAGFALVDAHDHTSGQGMQVPVAGLDIDADLAFGGFGVTTLGKAAFSAVTALASGTKTLFVSSADNELYWRTNAGTNVKLTAGTSINTTLVGGIVGDYTTVSAEVAYDDANSRYTFKAPGSPKTWARLASGPVRIHQFATSETVYVEHAIDAALASSYTVTWPAALPGAAALMQISAAGLVSYSNTTTEVITAADFRHTTNQVLQLPGAFWQDPNAAHLLDLAASGAQKGIRMTTAVGTNVITMPIPLKAGDQFTGYTIYMSKEQTAGAVTAIMYRQNMFSTGAESSLGASSSLAAGTSGYLTLAETFTHTIEEGYQYYLTFLGGGSVTPSADHVYAVSITFKRP